MGFIVALAFFGAIAFILVFLVPLSFALQVYAVILLALMVPLR